jgi:hypothetical protein
LSCSSSLLFLVHGFVNLKVFFQGLRQVGESPRPPETAALPYALFQRSDL